jgi:hypothetical protein
MLAIVVLGMLLSVAAYRYYTGVVRRSLLADLAFVYFLGAFLCAFVDIGLRGFTIDYIQLPGYVIADL